MKTFKIRDIRNTQAFPDLPHRFSRLIQKGDLLILERDYLGENPLHYIVDIKDREVTVGSNISDIKGDLESRGKPFVWERVRAVNNNTRITFDGSAFSTISPKEEDILPTLQVDRDSAIDCGNLEAVGPRLRLLLKQSVEQRLSTIQEDDIGLLLSGGLDSMSVGYVLSTFPKRVITAFTLKVNDNESDVVKAREIARDFGLQLVEVCVYRNGPLAGIKIQRYSQTRELIYEKNVESGIDVEKTVSDTLHVSGNPKKDNALCALSMNLISRAINAEGISTVFCGEGPNEMINDYGYNPNEFGYGTSEKGDIHFREALTFGLKKNDLQLGRGGLSKHALARMGKIFAEYGIRLESPYFDREIAKILTRIPHIDSFDKIKQKIMKKIFAGEKPEKFIEGTSKEKFQDGSGVSTLFNDYNQLRLLEIFEKIYGIRKTGYS